MKKSLLVSLLILSLATTPLLAANAQMPSEGTSAQMIGIGYIQGFSSTALAVFENPASLTYVNKRSFGSFYAASNEGQVQFSSFAVAMPTKFGQFGIGYLENKIPNQFATVLDGNGEYAIGSVFEYRNALLKAGISKQYSDRVHFGLAANYYSSVLNDISGSGYSLDFGALVNFNKLDLSFYGKNIFAGNKRYSSGAGETLQRVVVTSARYSMSNRLSVYGQLDQREGEKMLAAAGAKYYLLKFIYTSVGYGNFHIGANSRYRTNLGLGIELVPIQFHFAYEASDYPGQNGQYFFSANLNL